MLRAIAGLFLTFAFLALIAALIIAVIFCVGLVAGFVVHWLIPAVSLDASFIAGVIAALPALYVIYRIFSLPSESLQEDGEEREDTKTVVERVVYVADSFDLMQPTRRRSRRRKSPPPDNP